MGSLFKNYIFENNYGADFEPKGPGTKIHWCIDEEKKKNIYDDLGILGKYIVLLMCYSINNEFSIEKSITQFRQYAFEKKMI